MPKRLPLSIVFSGFLGTVAHAVRFWLHYTIVALAWLGVVPLTACRIYRTLFTGSVSSILSLPLNVLSTDNITTDILQGCAVVTLTLLAFIGLVWLREQIVHGGGPEWLDMDFDAPNNANNNANPVQQPQLQPLVGRDGIFGRQQPIPLPNDVDVNPEIDNQGQENQEQRLIANGNNDRNVLRNNVQDENEPPNIPEEPDPPEILDPPLNQIVPPANNEAEDFAGAVEQGPNINDNDLGVGNDLGEGADQWNPMEWDRAAEELTWERLLGLDGSLVFLEHVFWVVSLNTLFILVFAFCPYHIGHFTIMGFKLNSYIKGAHFEGMLTTLCGYCVIGLILVILHQITSICNFKKSSRIFGLCYVVVKVSLLLVIEILAFPVICGWWLDVCSLSLFDATLKDRQTSYHTSPMASIFMHWLVGMVYVFYFASFVILLREVLRPGVLWFLRNLNDPDFNPIQEMIHLSIARHMRRFCASLVMFGTSILVMLYLPSRIIKKTVPSFLPYQTAQATESQVDELAMELLLLLVILPAVQDQNHTKEWLKNLIRAWCRVAGYILDLRSYLFGDLPLEPSAVNGEDLEDLDIAEEAENILNNNHRVHDEPLQQGNEGDQDNIRQDQQDNPVDPVNDNERQRQPALAQPAAPVQAAAGGGGLGEVHQALFNQGPTGFQPYNKPKFFGLRITGLLVLMLLSWLISSLVLMLLPVWIGRQAFSFWFPGNSGVYELYTSATGLYTCLLLIRGTTLFTGWIQQGWAQVSHKLREWMAILARASVAVILLVGLIPLLFGFLLEVVVLMPVRVSLNQSPVFFLWQDWALGAMYTKITIALTFMGPDWWLKRAIEQLYLDGLRRLNLGFLIPKLVVPAVASLGLSLSLPYIAAHSLVPLVISEPHLLVMIQRRIYPFLLLLVVTIGLIVVQLKQFKKLYEHIKNDRYLVGRRLVNYNHNQVRGGSESNAATGASSS